MKVTVLQENLSKGLNIVSRIVGSKTTLPILGNVLLSTEKGNLYLQATNLETGITLTTGAKIEKEGKITVPARILTEFVSSLPSENVNLEVVETSLTILSGSFKAEIAGISASEFPKIPTSSDGEKIVFAKNELIKAFLQVGFAAAQDEGRPVLTGVLLKIKGKKISLVATDGYRLSVKEIGAKESTFEGDFLIPAKTIIEVCRIAQEDKSEEGEIKMFLSPEKSQVIFQFPQIELSSRLLEGEFPDFAKIIPSESTLLAEFDKEEFLKAVRIASIFAREQANIIKLKFEEEKMMVSAENPQIGVNEGFLEAKIKGEKTEIAFNFRFLLDYLNSPIDEEIVFEASGPLSPGVFRQKDDSSLLHIIMPVRIQV